MKTLTTLDMITIYDDVTSPLIFYGGLSASKGNLLCSIVYNGLSYQTPENVKDSIKEDYINWCERFVLQVLCCRFD